MGLGSEVSRPIDSTDPPSVKSSDLQFIQLMTSTSVKRSQSSQPARASSQARAYPRQTQTNTQSRSGQAAGSSSEYPPVAALSVCTRGLAHLSLLGIAAVQLCMSVVCPLCSCLSGVVGHWVLAVSDCCTHVSSHTGFSGSVSQGVVCKFVVES